MNEQYKARLRAMDDEDLFKFAVECEKALTLGQHTKNEKELRERTDAARGEMDRRAVEACVRSAGGLIDHGDRD